MHTQQFDIRRPTSPDTLAMLRALIGEAVRLGTRTIVLGGDAALENIDAFSPVLRDAKKVQFIVEEGSLIATNAVAALAHSGVTTLTLRILRRDPTQALQLARAWQAEGREVVVQLPLDEGAPSALSRLRFVHQALPSQRHFELAPRAATRAIANDIAESYAYAERAKLTLVLATDHPFPPCLAELPSRARPLLATRMRDEAPDAEPCRAHAACDVCALRGRCTVTATELARVARSASPKPIADATTYLRPGKSAGSRLRVLGAEEVTQFFHVDYDYSESDAGPSPDSAPLPTSRIGLIYRCNQTCTFCELADMDVDLSREVIERALEAARARGSLRVILTGGEPTLSKDLLHHIAHARTLGFEEIELQTNAVLLDKPGAAQALRDAGLTSAQVSLHGPDASVSDRLTAAPGTHARTLKGVDALLQAGVRVLLNHLIFVDNAPLLLDFVDMVSARWGTFRAQLVVQFHSPRNEFTSREEGLKHVPRYADYGSRLRMAIDRARAAGLTVRDLQDPTGIPALCVLEADAEYLGRIAAQHTSPRFHRWESDWLTHVPACANCGMRDACMGIPKHYLALHGDSEFAPMERR